MELSNRVQLVGVVADDIQAGESRGGERKKVWSAVLRHCTPWFVDGNPLMIWF
jgi:hypothetical protein